MYGTLFTTYIDDLEHRRTSSRIFSDFVNTSWINPGYRDTATHAELARDYIAGMTDRYFAKRFEEIVIPRRVEGRFP